MQVCLDPPRCSDQFAMPRTATESNNATKVALRTLAGSCFAGSAVVTALTCASIIPPVAGITLVASGIIMGSALLLIDSELHVPNYDYPPALEKMRREARFMGFTELLRRHSWENIVRYGIPTPKSAYLHKMQRFKEQLDKVHTTQRRTTESAEKDYERHVHGRRTILDAAIKGAELAYNAHPAHQRMLYCSSTREYALCERQLVQARVIRNGAIDLAKRAFDHATAKERDARDKAITKAYRESEPSIEKITCEYREMCQKLA